MKLVVVGATGAVGTEILKILAERDFPATEIVPVASPRSAGRRLDYKDSTIEVVALDADVFSGCDIALFDVPDDLAREWAPVAAEAGATVVDNSAAFRMDPAVPLVVPEANPNAAADAPKGIIASPNCSTLTMVVPLSALHRDVPVERVICATYQSVSGSGKGGVDELWDQSERAVKEAELVTQGLGRDVLEPGDVYAHPIAMNVIPFAGSLKDDGYTSEELKLCNETRKIMSVPDLRVTATCVRVPVMVAHSVAVHAEFAAPISAGQARSILREAPGVELQDEPERHVYPTPLQAAGRDPSYVGRIRQDPFSDRALELFCVSDNLRKGAALNTVQIAELLTNA